MTNHTAERFTAVVNFAIDRNQRPNRPDRPERVTDRRLSWLGRSSIATRSCGPETDVHSLVVRLDPRET